MGRMSPGHTGCVGVFAVAASALRAWLGSGRGYPAKFLLGSIGLRPGFGARYGWGRMARWLTGPAPQHARAGGLLNACIGVSSAHGLVPGQRLVVLPAFLVAWASLASRSSARSSTFLTPCGERSTISATFLRVP